MEPLPIPDESFWIDRDYYGYLGDELRFAERVYAEGTSFVEALAKLLATPEIAALIELKPDKVRISLGVTGYRPMTEEDQAEREVARRVSAERETTREERERENLRRTLQRFGIPVERHIFEGSVET